MSKYCSYRLQEVRVCDIFRQEFIDYMNDVILGDGIIYDYKNEHYNISINSINHLANFSIDFVGYGDKLTLFPFFILYHKLREHYKFNYQMKYKDGKLTFHFEYIDVDKFKEIFNSKVAIPVELVECCHSFY